MFSPLRILSVLLALVLGGQIVIAHQFADDGSTPIGTRSAGPGGGPYIKATINFVDADRLAIYNYYGGIAHAGKCPLGTLKADMGCLSAADRAWKIGRVLPRDVVFYDLPPDLAHQLAQAPAGYRYIRAGADVLLIARGSGVVAAAIEDLARL